MLTEDQRQEIAAIAEAVVAEAAPLAVLLFDQITRLESTGAMKMAALKALADVAAKVITVAEPHQPEGMSMEDFFQVCFELSLRQRRNA